MRESSGMRWKHLALPRASDPKVESTFAIYPARMP
jgi:hypothetical protein